MSDDVQSVNWILTTAAIFLTGGRLLIRFSKSRHLQSDDYAHIFALTLLIVHGATNQITLAAKAKNKIDVAPNSHIPTSTLLQEYYHLHVLNTVNNVFLYAIMWTVKIAFLLCYRQLFQHHPNFMRAWWTILLITILSYIPPFYGVVHTCAGASTLSQYKDCNSGNAARSAKLIYTCVLNVVTDISIMALPLWMLHKLHITTRQKMGLGFVFCLAFFCVALDILRTAEALAQNQALYTVLEVNFTVIVSCLPTYRGLLAGSKLFAGNRRSSDDHNHDSQGSGSDDRHKQSGSTGIVNSVMTEVNHNHNCHCHHQHHMPSFPTYNYNPRDFHFPFQSQQHHQQQHQSTTHDPKWIADIESHAVSEGSSLSGSERRARNLLDP